MILYADRVTASMQAAIDETERRREIQIAFNTANNITPRSVSRVLSEDEMGGDIEQPKDTKSGRKARTTKRAAEMGPEDLAKAIKSTREAMMKAAKELEFERAAELRDRLKVLQSAHLALA